MDSQDGSEILPLTITTDLGPHSPNGHSRAPKSPSKAALKKRIRAPPGSAKPEETRVLHTHGRRTLYTAGRPPWYNKEGQLKNAFVIGKT